MQKRPLVKKGSITDFSNNQGDGTGKNIEKFPLKTLLHFSKTDGLQLWLMICK